MSKHLTVQVTQPKCNAQCLEIVMNVRHILEPNLDHSVSSVLLLIKLTLYLHSVTGVSFRDGLLLIKCDTVFGSMGLSTHDTKSALIQIKMIILSSYV